MEIGNIHGAPAKKFGLYYGKWGDDTTQKYRFSNFLYDAFGRPFSNEKGNQVWWRILFWGMYRKDKHFEWKLQPKRDRQTAIHALAHAKYCCEVNVKHSSFIRKNSDKKYTEPHHLVPMSCSDQFDVSLDVEENIVSLCSNCHNEIHYGKNADVLIKKLYWERKGDLEKAGICISLEKLLNIYGFI